tara:strand:- start:140 stop:502 length:363 start_codon:yes stop_codon:yes gene_type:complete
MSTLNVSNITDGTTTVGTSYVVNGSAKAWCNFDGDPATVVTSLNVSSLTDAAVGSFFVTFTNSFSEEHNSTGTRWNSASNNNCMESFQTANLTNQQIVTFENGSATDPSRMRMVTHGDLA